MQQAQQEVRHAVQPEGRQEHQVEQYVASELVV